jgi:hypothetical protein
MNRITANTVRHTKALDHQSHHSEHHYRNSLSGGGEGGGSSSLLSSSDSTSSLLYRYGQEIPSLGGNPQIDLLPAIAPLNSGRNMINPASSFLPSSDEEATIFSQISSLSKIRPKNLKIVSGSQFRLTTKATNGSSAIYCEQCDLLDKANKKNKEIIRTLKLQLTRMEESFKDLKYSRAIDAMSHMIPSDAHKAIMEREEREGRANGQDTGNVPSSKKVERLEEEVLRLKKLLSFERNTTEALRQSIEESKLNYDNEMAKIKGELEKSLKAQSLLESSNNAFQFKIKEMEIEITRLRDQLDQNNKVSHLRYESSLLFVFSRPFSFVLCFLALL